MSAAFTRSSGERPAQGGSQDCPAKLLVAGQKLVLASLTREFLKGGLGLANTGPQGLAYTPELNSRPIPCGTDEGVQPQGSAAWVLPLPRGFVDAHGGPEPCGGKGGFAHLLKSRSV